MDERKTIQEIMTPAVKSRLIWNFPQFIKMLRDTWYMISPKGVQFIHAYPVKDGENIESIQSPIIDYIVFRKHPSDMGSEKEIKPRIRVINRDPNNPQQTSTVFAQRFTYIVDFGIWGTDWDEVEELQEQFEEFMLTYAGMFKELGVSELIYQEATENFSRTSSTRAGLVSSHIFYRVDIEKTLEVFNQIIESIKVKLRKQEEN
jgi:hypothetical protein